MASAWGKGRYTEHHHPPPNVAEGRKRRKKVFFVCKIGSCLYSVDAIKVAFVLQLAWVGSGGGGGGGGGGSGAPEKEEEHREDKVEVKKVF